MVWRSSLGINIFISEIFVHSSVTKGFGFRCSIVYQGVCGSDKLTDCISISDAFTGDLSDPVPVLDSHIWYFSNRSVYAEMLYLNRLCLAAYKVLKFTKYLRSVGVFNNYSR